MNKKRWALFSVVILMAAACMLAVFRLGAATPPTGTISTTSAPVSWQGSGAFGLSATGENVCVEMPGVHVNCDTFTLTVTGTPAQWAGKQINVSISWVVLASDYDLYVHKDSNTGPEIGKSTAGAPGNRETVAIQPADLDLDGSTVFTAHVVYSVAAAGDQYSGTVSAEAAAGGPTPTPVPLTKSKNWTINYHGQCCEGNLAAAGDNTFVLLPVLVMGNKIKKSSDGGKTWVQKYPPVPASVPYGIEGDMQAFGDDVIFFGTELAAAVVAHSDDKGETYLLVQNPVASAGNDQAWAYLGPLANMNPNPPGPFDEPYVLAGWMRIGTAIAFSFDGGRTFTTQSPLVGNNGSGPEHIVCQQNAAEPVSPDPGDTRVANPLFANQKAGRHGAWGTDRKFYWSETAANNLYVCQTNDFGVNPMNWTGNKHPLSPGPGSDFVVSHTAFDNNGTLYVLHGNKLYVSFNQGKTIAYTHTLPRYGSARKSDPGSDQYFVADCGTVHIGVQEDAGNGAVRVVYLRGTRADTANITWDQELVDEVGDVRLDFLYIVLDGNDIPTISYTTPDVPGPPVIQRDVTTASRNAPMLALGGSTCSLVSVSAASRKTHGPSGPFEVPLPLNGPAGIECRAGGGSNLDTHQVVVKFGEAASFNGVVDVIPEAGKQAELNGLPTMNAANTELTINLKNVSDVQTLTMTLQNVVTAGGAAANVVVPMMVLAGDTNDDARVNVTDTTQTKSRSGQLTEGGNFRSDVNLDGRINVGDVNFVKAHAGASEIKPTRARANK